MSLVSETRGLTTGGRGQAKPDHYDPPLWSLVIGHGQAGSWGGCLRGLAPSCERRREPAKHHTGVVCEHPSVKAPKAAREQDGSVWKSLVYVTLYIRFPNLATRRAALAGEH